MAKFKRAAVVLTAAESARQWARSNPDQADAYIDKAAGFIDQRTQGKYHKQLTGLTKQAKKALTGREGVSGRTVPGETVPGETGQTGTGNTGTERRRGFPEARH